MSEHALGMLQAIASDPGDMQALAGTARAGRGIVNGAAPGAGDGACCRISGGGSGGACGTRGSGTATGSPGWEPD